MMRSNVSANDMFCFLISKKQKCCLIKWRGNNPPPNLRLQNLDNTGRWENFSKIEPF